MKHPFHSLRLLAILCMAATVGACAPHPDPDVRRGRIGGAAIGAGLGAIIGSNSGRISTGEGAIVGAVIGGILGDAHGKANSSYNRRVYHPYQYRRARF